MRKTKSVQLVPPEPATATALVSELPIALGGSDKTPHNTWSGLLTFGFVSMPVSLFTAATEEKVGFNQLCACHSRIKQQLFCPSCEKVVKKSDLLKGYEYEKDKYIVIDEKELKAAEPKSGKVLELTAFIPSSQIDPIFFESTYYLAPKSGGEKPYALLLQAMRETSLVGVLRITRGGREHICALRPYHEGMILQTLYWNSEVRPMTFPSLPDVTDADKNMAKQVIGMLATTWDPGQYSDSYHAAVLKLIATKREGKEFVSSPETTQSTNVVDIGSALARSLEMLKQKKGA